MPLFLLKFSIYYYNKSSVGVQTSQHRDRRVIAWLWVPRRQTLFRRCHFRYFQSKEAEFYISSSSFLSQACSLCSPNPWHPEIFSSENCTVRWERSLTRCSSARVQRSKPKFKRIRGTSQWLGFSVSLRSSSVMFVWILFWFLQSKPKAQTRGSICRKRRSRLNYDADNSYFVRAAATYEFIADLSKRTRLHLSPDMLVGKYIPNLVGKPFDISHEYAQLIYDQTSPRLDKVLRKWEEDRWTDAAQCQKLAYIVLVELLAYQFTSPVLWIETQDVLFVNFSFERLIELDLSPTLTGMAICTMKAKYEARDDSTSRSRSIICHAKHGKEIYYQFEDESEAAEATEQTLPLPSRPPPCMYQPPLLPLQP